MWCSYEEGTSLVHKGGLAAAFIKTDSPVEFLGTYTSLAFSGPEGQRLLAHPATDAEVRALCEDLKVLGKREFKALLKWRIAVRQQDKEEQGPAEEEAKPKEEEEEGADSEREEAGVLGEMAELRAVMEAKKKKARKVAAKKKEKARARTATGMSLDALGEGEGVYADEELFALGSIKSGKGLAKVVPDDEEGAGEGGEEDEMDTEEGADEGAADEDGEEEDDLDEDAEEKR